MAAEALISDTVLRRLGRALAWVCLGATWLVAPARAAELVEIRVGVHPGFTRIVFELDSEVGYSVARPATEGATDELVVDVAAHSLRRVVTSRSDLVETVRIEPSESGSVARIGLRGGAVQVADMLLLHPPRIVIDLRKPSPVVAAADASSRAAEPGGSPEPPAVDEAESTEQAPPEETESEGAPRTADAESEVPALAEGEETATPPDATATTEPSAETPVTDEHAQELAGGETDLGEAPFPSEETAPETVAEPKTTPTPVTPAAGRPVAAPRGGGTGLPAPFDDSRVLVAAAGALLLVLLLALRMRRRSSARSRLPEFPPFEEEPEPSDEPVVEAHAEEDLAALAVPSAQELGRAGRSAEPAPRASSLFDTGYDVEPDDDAVGARPGFEPATEPALRAGSGLAGAGPPLRAVGSESERRVEELERRVAHLEKRLEEVAEMKDRLDRQLATQNEELRVQRAAIARTQRVLRNLSRPEDSATEPAPKGPGSQPPGGVR